MKSCFFIGHKDVPQSIGPHLADEIERLVLCEGVSEFIVGNYGAFDYMVQSALVKTKYRYPHITLLLLLPYHPAERQIQTPQGFDNTFYPPDMEKVPRQLAIVRANR